MKPYAKRIGTVVFVQAVDWQYVGVLEEVELCPIEGYRLQLRDVWRLFGEGKDGPDQWEERFHEEWEVPARSITGASSALAVWGTEDWYHERTKEHRKARALLHGKRRASDGEA